MFVYWTLINMYVCLLHINKCSVNKKMDGKLKMTYCCTCDAKRTEPILNSGHWQVVLHKHKSTQIINSVFFFYVKSLYKICKIDKKIFKYIVQTKSQYR